MGLIRLVVILVIVWLVYSITRRWIASLEQKKEQKKQQRPSRISTMVSCAHCGLHVPQDDALQAQGKYYCSDEHKRLSASE